MTNRAQRWKQRRQQRNKCKPTQDVSVATAVIYDGVGLINGIMNHSIPKQGAWDRSINKAARKPGKVVNV